MVRASDMASSTAWPKKEPMLSSIPFMKRPGQRVADEVRGLGRKSISVAADVAQKEGPPRLKAALDEFGKVDILVDDHP
jgi:hypothetical protein